jgi:uncharacterized membrane protein
MEFLLFLLYIAVVYLLVKVNTLSTKVHELDARITLLAAPPAQSTQQTVAPLEAAPAITAPPPPPQPEPIVLTATPTPPPPPVPEATVPEPVPVPPPSKKQRTSQEWEWLIGGKLLNRIAAVALVLGVSFFLKYAIDRNWISEWMQIGIGIAAGSALLFGASRMNRKGFQIFSQGLVGAGIAILYLSVYASFNYYSLVSQPVAFLMMGTVTVVTFLQAFRYDSQAVALLGWAGGFATPFLLSRGEANAGGLFGYIALLDAGLLAVIAVRKKWWVLLPLAFTATWLIFALWVDTKTGHEDDLTGGIAVTAFWLLFHMLDVYRSTREQQTTWLLERIIAVLSGTFFYFAFYYLLDDQYHAQMGLFTLLAAGVYTVSIVAVRRSRSVQSEPLVHYGAAALVLLVCATETQFDGFPTTYAYAFEVVLLMLVARWRSNESLWAASTLLLVWSACALLFQDHAWSMVPVEGTTPVLNGRLLAFVLLAGAAVVGLRGVPRTDRTWTPLVRGGLHTIWLVLLGILLPAEIADALRGAARPAEEMMGRHLRYLIGPCIGVAWTAYAAIIVHMFRTRKTLVPPVLAACFGILGALVTAAWNGAGYTPPEWFTVIFNWHFPASLLALAATVWLARSFATMDGPLASLSHAFTAAWIVVGFATLTAEIVDLYARFIRLAPESGALPFERLMVLAAAWTLYGAAVFSVGRRSVKDVPLVGGLVLVLAGWITALVRGVAFEPVTAFTPVLNMRMAMILVTIGGLIALRVLASRQEGSPSWLKPAPPVLRIMTALLVLALVTGEIRDYFEKAIALNDPSVAERELESIKQLMLSGAWLAFSISLMAYGIIGRERTLRFLAIVLFGVAILKIFIYDLSFLETLYRIFSFIGLGLILLAVSYLYQRYRDVIFSVETDAKADTADR